MSASLFHLPALASSGGDRYDMKRTPPGFGPLTTFFTTPLELATEPRLRGETMSFDGSSRKAHPEDAPARASQNDRTPGPRHIRPDIEAFEVTLARIAGKSTGRLRDLAEEAIELEADAKTEPQKWENPAAVGEFLRVAFPQRASITGWYFSVLDRQGKPLTRVYCAQCVGDRWNSPTAKATRLTPMYREDMAGDETCAKCRRGTRG